MKVQDVNGQRYKNDQSHFPVDKHQQHNKKPSVAAQIRSIGGHETGVAACDFISSLASEAMKKYPNITVNVRAIRNDFFGGSVTVSGLVTGGDIINQLKESDLGDALLIPENMLRAEGDLFLDNVSVEQLSKELGVSVIVTQRGGYALCEAMTGLNERN